MQEGGGEVETLTSVLPPPPPEALHCTFVRIFLCMGEKLMGSTEFQGRVSSTQGRAATFGALAFPEPMYTWAPVSQTYMWVKTPLHNSH